MLQGDSLSVQLFIAAAAISALSVAMTQAGWTHKWFVRGVFGLTGLLAIASMGWPYFEARTPFVSEALQAASQSRIAWFFMAITPAVIGGMLVSDSLRQRRERGWEKARQPTKWLPVLEASEAFARQDLIDRYNYVMQQSGETSHKSTTLGDEIEKLHRAMVHMDDSSRREAAKKCSRLSAEHQELRRRCEELWQTLSTCSEVLRSNIHHQLREGQLVAKGFLDPHIPGAAEKIIPTEEWRFLQLDDEADQALGPNFQYIALLIGKPSHYKGGLF